MASKINKISNILYAPWRFGQPKIGVEHGSSIVQNIVNEVLSLSSSSIQPISKMIAVNESHINNNEKYHYDLYKARISAKENTLVVGGDHSVAVGSLMGTLTTINKLNQKKGTTSNNNEINNLGVIWIDAHADINTLESSESGNIHGMPLAFITGIDKTWEWVNDIGLQLKYEHLYYWGLRDLDIYEIDIIDKYGIKVCSDKDEIIQIIDEYQYIHTSLDIDGLDPKYTPSTGTRADHGLELKDVLDCLYYLKFSNKSMGFDLVEYNPEIGTDEEKYITEQTVKSLLHAIL
eukprot:202687_1